MAKMVTEGMDNAMGVFLKGDTRPDLYVGLFLDSAEPGFDAVLSDITEPVGNGYARQLLTSGSWTIADGVATQAVKTFTCSGTAWGNVYGWFICTVLSGTSGVLYTVQLFTAPSGPYYIDDTEEVIVTPVLVGV